MRADLALRPFTSVGLSFQFSLESEQGERGLGKGNRAVGFRPQCEYS